MLRSESLKSFRFHNFNDKKIQFVLNELWFDHGGVIRPWFNILFLLIIVQHCVYIACNIDSSTNPKIDFHSSF